MLSNLSAAVIKGNSQWDGFGNCAPSCLFDCLKVRGVVSIIALPFFLGDFSGGDLVTSIVTGAAGFIGSHICERLVKEGHHVIAVDNLCTGTSANKSFVMNLDSSKVIFLGHDVIQSWDSWLLSIPHEWLSRLKYIFHFASPASPPLFEKFNVETMWVNSRGLENAILLANKYNARVIFASTSEVYGDPDFSPQAETYWGNVNSFGVRSCYDEAKRFGEALIFSYNNRYKTKHGLVRIFNTYGPRMNPYDGRVIINFLVQGLKDEPLTIYGDGSQTRSFCYVSDLIEGIWRYAESDLSEPVNLGNPTEFSIKELAKIITEEVFPEKVLEVQHCSLPKDDPKQRKPDISKAFKLLNGWQPKVPLREGIKLMLDALKNESF